MFDPAVPKAIDDACARLDHAKAHDLVQGLIHEIRGANAPYPLDLAKEALNPLRRKRYFDEALPLADAIFESGQHDPAVRQFYLQALIDTGRLEAAIPYAELLIRDTEPKSKVHDEARGLLGRAYKQLYVNGAGDKATRDEHLRRSFQAYYDVYAETPSKVYQGINAVAVLHRAAEDDVELPKVQAFEEDIYDAMRVQVEANTADEWGMATAGEAAIALGDMASAIQWYERYSQGDPKFIDAFELNSSLRQLIEVWRLSFAKTPGKELLPLLRAELLKRTGGELTFKPEELTRERDDVQGLQKTFGPNGYQSIQWYGRALDLCKAVCRVEGRVDGLPRGTGFLVRGGDFNKKLGDEPLILTNHHVLNDEDPKATAAGAAVARFMALSEEKRYSFDPEIVWTSPDVDATLVRFSRAVPHAEPFPPGDKCPKLSKKQDPPIPCVYIIHHPKGGPLSISFQNNELVATNAERLHYRAATEEGSSGSPVFDDQWNLVGLHRRGLEKMPSLWKKGDTYQANEAFWIGAVRDACGKDTVKKKVGRRLSGRR